MKRNPKKQHGSLRLAEALVDGDLKVVRYEDTQSGKPPIIASAVPPSKRPATDVPKEKNDAVRPKTSPVLPTMSPKVSLPRIEFRRDSGLAPTATTVRNSMVTTSSDGSSVTRVSSLPRITVQDEGGDSEPIRDISALDGGLESEIDESPMRLTTAIPSGDLLDFGSPGAFIFSNRGSLVLSGKRQVLDGQHMRPVRSPREPVISTISNSGSFGGRLLSTDEDLLSQKVRLMYEYGDADATSIGGRLSSLGDREWANEEAILEDDADDSIGAIAKAGRSASVGARRDSWRISRATCRRESMIKREQWEIAGGIEDWEDVNTRDVDRYGFIVPRPSSSKSSSSRAETPMPPLKRVSTALFLASEAPRGKRTLRRASSTIGASRSPTPSALNGRSSRRSFIPSGSVISQTPSRSFSLNLPEHPWRYATNRLPGNKGRRWVDEAGDMLTLPPGLAGIAEKEEGAEATLEMKTREWRRADKWRKMAKLVNEGKNGQGMVFDFDTRDPKLISRTWKGIPDCWRATAWHSFLTASAKRRGGYPSDDEIIDKFYKTDCRSVRQRLLFRVLHALSLYFPDVGYVQGMASLAATLLCYYDEDTTFIMLTRLWELRGLKRLYQSGFEGLMQGLEEFEQKWLAGGDVYQKLSELGIGPTAYGTRWYLTLFNYSIPFPAQLRVWDVFMLLGDPNPTVAGQAADNTGFSGGLDVLHATSAALVDGMREILLDSDFENGMKVLTSWIPIKDEELLMKVAKAEWRQNARR
ncbi:hypothetical protein FGG08_002845 [Glutinoglossum americanum]|uniref:Rab-GAP TBC domain-containing protein n=1 Tax=Glutinoglossum americanum TaxID=1670608 RepID=A0A9P8L595_9PEZI|nr:hypothetical protein FGG08_002845 [Glutinoglossum americanum]